MILYNNPKVMFLCRGFLHCLFPQCFLKAEVLRLTAHQCSKMKVRPSGSSTSLPPTNLRMQIAECAHYLFHQTMMQKRWIPHELLAYHRNAIWYIRFLSKSIINKMGMSCFKKYEIIKTSTYKNRDTAIL